MPVRPPKECGYPGCAEYALPGNSRCEKHKHKAWNHKKSRHERGYGSDWEKRRERILKRDNYLCQCEECKDNGWLTEANEVDHITPKAQGGTDDDWNLRAINNECHKKKTREESNQGKQRRWL